MAENLCVNQEIVCSKRNISDTVDHSDSNEPTNNDVKCLESGSQIKRLKMDETTENPETSSSENQPISRSESNTRNLSESNEESEFVTSETANNDESDNISDVSGISDISIDDLNAEAKWRNVSGPVGWVQRQMMMGVSPRTVLEHLIPGDVSIPDDIDDMSLWKAVIDMLTEPPRREKLPDVNLLEDVVNLILKSKNVIVLTGAGVSVSCGIPDFRSKDGIYSRLAVEYPDLPDPQAMFDIRYFQQNQKPFFKFAKEIYPGQFKPSVSHTFIRQIEEHGKLLRNFTQNIDTLEQVADIENVVQCHGSFVTASCMKCKHRVDHKVIEEDIMNQVIPYCPVCPKETELAIMKPDIVFFGESLPEEFHRQMDEDKDKCDLLIVMGSSLKVRPVALIPNSLPAYIPQILINREPLKHLTFDVELLGDCDYIVQELCMRLGQSWTSICNRSEQARQVLRDEMVATTPERQAVVTSGKQAPQIGDEREKPRAGDTGEVESEQTKIADLNTSSDTIIRRSNQENISQNGSSSNRNVTSQGSREIISDESSVDSSLKEPLLAKQGDNVESTLSNDSKSSDTNILSKDTDNSVTSDLGSSIGLSENSQNRILNSPCENSNNKKASGDMDSKEPGDSKQHSGGNHGAAVMDTDKDGGHDDEPTDSGELNKEDLEKMRSFWKPRHVNLASQLEEGTFLYLPPNRYIFKGAEFLQDLDEVSDGSSSSSSSEAGGTQFDSDFDAEEQGTGENGDFAPDVNEIQAAVDRNEAENGPVSVEAEGTDPHGEESKTSPALEKCSETATGKEFCEETEKQNIKKEDAHSLTP